MGRLLTVARIRCSVLVIAVPVSMLVVHELWIKIVLLAVFVVSVIFWRSVQLAEYQRRIRSRAMRGASGGSPVE